MDLVLTITTFIFISFHKETPKTDAPKTEDGTLICGELASSTFTDDLYVYKHLLMSAGAYAPITLICRCFNG